MTGNPQDAEAWEWDDDNESELAAHGIEVREVYEVWANRPILVPNRRSRAGDWKIVGLTNGGRRISIVLKYSVDRRIVRPITGWNCTKGEISKYLL